MLGKKSSLRLPVLWALNEGGRNSVVGQSGVEDELTGWEKVVDSYFPDWSKWNTKTIGTTLNLLGAAVYTNSANTYSLTRGGTSVNYQIPVHTLFDINTIKSGIAKYNGERLNLSGGIPLLVDSDETGKLEINLKCSKYNINVTSPDIDHANWTARLKLKKSQDNNGITNDYLFADDGTTVKKYDGSTTSLVEDVKLTIESVEKGDSVWLNIDPINSGTYIKIDSLDMKITY